LGRCDGPVPRKGSVQEKAVRQGVKDEVEEKNIEEEGGEGGKPGPN